MLALKALTLATVDCITPGPSAIIFTYTDEDQETRSCEDKSSFNLIVSHFTATYEAQSNVI